MSSVASESAVQSLRPGAYHDRPTAGAGHGPDSGAFAMLLDSSAPPSDPPARSEPSKAPATYDRRNDAAPERDRPDSVKEPEPAKRAANGTDDTGAKSAQPSPADDPSPPKPTQSDSPQAGSAAATEADEAALAALVDVANADAGAGDEKADKDKSGDDADAGAIAPAVPALAQATPKPGDVLALAAAVPGTPAEGANASSDQPADADIAPVTAQSGQVGPVDQQPEAAAQGKAEGKHAQPGALKPATAEAKSPQGAADSGPLDSRPAANGSTDAPEQPAAHGETNTKFAEALAAERSGDKPGAMRSEVAASNHDTLKPNAAPPPGLEPTPAIASPGPTMWRASVAHSVPTSEHTVPVAGLAVEIAARAHEGLKRFDIRLDPPELGRIEVRLDVDNNGQVTSRLTVDRPATLDLLRSDAHALERALQSAGLNTDGGLQFSLRDQSLGGRDPGTGGRAPQMIVPDDEMARSDSAAAGYARLAALRGGVDIRV